MAQDEPIQKKRLLRMTLAHYRQPGVSEDEFHRFVTEEHAARAARLHAKNGVEGYSLFFSPASFRETSAALNASLGNKWFVRDYDVHVEFLFRDMDTLVRLASDPDFQALHAAEEPFVSGIHVEVSIGWVETYVGGGQVINIREDGKPDYPSFKALSIAPPM